MPTVDLNTGMEVIEPGECWALLATEEVGRIVVVLANQAEIFPVNYVVDEGTVMFRTDPGTKLAGSMSGPVLLEVDHVDPETRTAWSVIIRGRAHQVTSEDLALQRRISSLALSIWLPTTKQHLIRITPTTVTGRRIQGHRQSPTSEPSPTTRRQAMNAELTQLGREECLRLLAATNLGRVAVNVPGWPPMIRPVNYVFDQSSQSVVFRSARGSKFTGLLQSGQSAFEIDGIDPVAATRWSVIVAGTTEEVSNAAEVHRLERLGLRPWAPGDKPHWIRLRTPVVTGRCIAPPDPSARNSDPGPA